MSYIYFIASERPLPAGKFGYSPRRIFGGYAEYMASEDYVSHPRGYNSMEEWKAEERRRRENCGKVAVYETLGELCGTWLTPFGFHPERVRQETVIAQNFTLPHIYHLYFADLGYFCRFLHPGERVELYSRWVDDLELPYAGRRETIDLQDILDGRIDADDTIYADADFFYTLIAPRTFDFSGRIAALEEEYYDCVVVPGTGFVGFTVKPLSAKP